MNDADNFIRLVALVDPVRAIEMQAELWRIRRERRLAAWTLVGCALGVIALIFVVLGILWVCGVRP